MSANDRQVGGSHYQSQFQHWDFVAYYLDNRYLEGQITKYVSRWRKKNGLQDLEKAEHFLSKLEDLFTSGVIRPMRQFKRTEPAALAFCEANELSDDETKVIVGITGWEGQHALTQARDAIQRLLVQARAMAPAKG